MSFFQETFGKGSRPYPLDAERRRRVLVELANRDMTISGLAKSINLAQSYISYVINGRRISPNTEQRIAGFLGKPADYLFPRRSPEEIRKMRRAESARAETARKGKPA